MGTDRPLPNLGGYGPFQDYACQAPNGWLSGNLWTTRGVRTRMGGDSTTASIPTGRTVAPRTRPRQVVFPQIRRLISATPPGDWYRERRRGPLHLPSQPSSMEDQTKRHSEVLRPATMQPKVGGLDEIMASEPGARFIRQLSAVPTPRRATDTSAHGQHGHE
jgi:hypothetical protein